VVVAFAVTIDDEHSLQFSRAVQRQILTATYRAIGDRWQTKWLPRHFTRRARDIYGYHPRSKKYQARKERAAQRAGSKIKKGGRVDLVYTGLAERLFSKRHAIRAYPTRATINIHGPTYVSMRPRQGNTRAIGPEVLKVIPEELRDLDDTGQKTLETLMKKAPRRQRKIKGR